MKIRIIKETEDIREGRNKILPEGRVLRCTPELAQKYLEAELAELIDAPKEVVKRRRTNKKIKQDG
jgi:hypothetical protein